MYQMIIGTYTKRGSEGIYLLEMDDILQQVRVISVIGEKNPSYLCLDSEKMFVCCFGKRSWGSGCLQC